MPNQSVAGALAARATTDPEGVFLVCSEGEVTFGQLESRAEALAASLSGAVPFQWTGEH